MGASNMSPDMINFQIQNMKMNLENIRLQIPHLFLAPIQLSLNGIEVMNLGIKILNTIIQFSKIGMETQSNLYKNFKDIGFQLQNIGNQFHNLIIPNIGIQNNNNNMEMKIQMKNIVFQNRLGKLTNITVPFGTTIKKTIELFYERRPELKGIKNEIKFIYNSIEIKDVNEKVEDLFLWENPRVLVTDCT